LVGAGIRGVEGAEKDASLRRFLIGAGSKALLHALFLTSRKSKAANSLFGPYLGSGKTLIFFRNPSPMLSLVMPETWLTAMWMIRRS